MVASIDSIGAIKSIGPPGSIGRTWSFTASATPSGGGCAGLLLVLGLKCVSLRRWGFFWEPDASPSPPDTMFASLPTPLFLPRPLAPAVAARCAALAFRRATRNSSRVRPSTSESESVAYVATASVGEERPGGTSCVGTRSGNGVPGFAGDTIRCEKSAGDCIAGVAFLSDASIVVMSDGPPSWSFAAGADSSAPGRRCSMSPAVQDALSCARLSLLATAAAAAALRALPRSTGENGLPAAAPDPSLSSRPTLLS
mmetsp:Transcript_7165/g.21054  ORF Transcript_7165/g.21054 Transcript_7165/m.21054 type:complete len:255 (-) Transcript_7165:449-1213(-)